MAALSDSFSKFVSKIGENVIRRTEKTTIEQPLCEEPSTSLRLPRPGSPFIMLMSEGEEGDEEIQFNFKKVSSIKNDVNGTATNGFEDSALGSSTSFDTINDKQLSDLPKHGEMAQVTQNHSSGEVLDKMSIPEHDYDSSDNEEAAMLENDEQRSHRNTPLTKDQFEKMFDQSGRLIQEHELRKCIFKGGMDDTVRKECWKFLFELYPFNSTLREREVLAVENIVRYEAMKIRWKKILKTLINEYEGVRYCPKWYSGCPGNIKEYIEDSTVQTNPSESFCENGSYVEEFQAEITPKADVHENNTKEIIKSQSEYTNELEALNSHSKLPDYIQGQRCSTPSNKIDSGTASPDKEDILDHNNKLTGTDTHLENESIIVDEDVEDIDYVDNVLHPESEIETPDTKIELRKEFNNISDALADAMLECQNDENKDTSGCSENSLLFVDKDLSIESPDYLCPELSPRPFNNDDLVHVNNDITIGAIATSDQEREIFPNPFTLPPEFINTTESLYSQSENFQSLDFNSLNNGRTSAKDNPPSISTILKNINSTSNLSSESSNITNVAPTNSDDTYNGNNYLNSTEEPTLELDSNENLKLNSLYNSLSSYRDSPDEIDVETNSENVTINDKKTEIIEDNELMCQFEIELASGDDNIEETNEIVKPAMFVDRKTTATQIDNGEKEIITTIEENTENYVIDKPIENGIEKQIEGYTEKQIESDTEKQIDNDNERQTEANHSLNYTPTKSKSVIIENNSRILPLTIEDSITKDRSYIAKSPTGESLEKLPPWIAQMIRASTPAEKSPTRTNAMNPFEIEMDEFSKSEKERRQKEGEITEQKDKERLQLDKELLGIIENANRFVEESIKNRSGHTTPKANSVNSTPRLAVKKRKNDETQKRQDQTSMFMSPLPNAEVDIFLHDTPSLKLVSEAYGSFDNVDFSPKVRSCPYCSFQSDVSTKILLPPSFGEDQLKFMEIQAQVFAARQPYDDKTISASIRVIDKDIPRTDRELEMFSGNSNPGLLKLRDALLTYAFFHPDVGYAQGMNDIMSRFLFVMDSEEEAYWMFVNYMEHFKNDFMEAGMLRKIALVEQLLMKMDRELYDFLQSTDMGLIFCHRWLLLNFKREFDYIEAIRLFEITSSRHLEVSSLEAEIERSKERAKEFVKDNAGSHMEEVFLSPEYPFDIFVCVAMLMECRHMIMGTADISAVYQILSNLPTTLDLQNILRRSEELFYRYCRKTTVDCFQIIDDLEVKDFKRKKNPFSFNFGQS